MTWESFCRDLEARIAEIRSALRREVSPLLEREAEAAPRLRGGREALAALLSGIDRRLAEIPGLCPAGADRTPGFDEKSREGLRRALAEIGSRRGRDLLPDSLSWVSG